MRKHVTLSDRTQGSFTLNDQSQIGLTGLAVMGANLARNIARHGYSIAVHNRTPAKTRDFIEEYGGEGAITGTESIEEFVAALERPRKIIIMVKAGAPVDAVIDELAPLLDEGDIIIDAGNSHFPDTAPAHARRAPSAACASSAPACRAARRARSTARASCPAATARPRPRSSRSSPRSPPTWTARRAASTSAPTAPATT